MIDPIASPRYRAGDTVRFLGTGSSQGMIACIVQVARGMRGGESRYEIEWLRTGGRLQLYADKIELAGVIDRLGYLGRAS